MVSFKKSEAGKHLEAFSIQLVILAIWKQALHICHTQAASAVEGSPTQHATTLRETMKRGQGCLNVHNPVDASNTLGPQDVCSHIQRSFLSEVQNAEELSKFVEPGISLMSKHFHFLLHVSYFYLLLYFKSGIYLFIYFVLHIYYV